MGLPCNIRHSMHIEVADIVCVTLSLADEGMFALACTPAL